MNNNENRKSFNLEPKVKRLEEIATSIQNPNIGIDEALRLYKEGIQLSKECKLIILDIEKEVKELSRMSGNNTDNNNKKENDY